MTSEAILRTYSLFYVDPEGRAGLSQELRAPDDGIALEMAGRRFKAGVVEVWERQRLVARLQPPGASE